MPEDLHFRFKKNQSSNALMRQGIAPDRTTDVARQRR